VQPLHTTARTVNADGDGHRSATDIRVVTDIRVTDIRVTDIRVTDSHREREHRRRVPRQGA
jgi:hypothetical protein